MSFEETTKKTYNTISRNWETKRKYSWEPVKEFITEIEEKENKVLIDIGCGTGRHLELAEKKGFKKNHCIGLDYSEGQLEVTAEKGFTTIHCDMTNLLVDSKSVDFILCIATHHHLLNREEQLKALQEMERILKDDGRVLLSNWFPSEEFIEEQVEKGKFEFINESLVKVKYHFDGKIYDRYYYLFDEEEIEELCEEAGFQVEDSEINKGNLYLNLVKLSV